MVTTKGFCGGVVQRVAGEAGHAWPIGVDSPALILAVTDDLAVVICDEAGYLGIVEGGNFRCLRMLTVPGKKNTESDATG